MVEFKILGKPKPKQSARFYAKSIGGKNIIKSYQKKEVKELEKNVSTQVLEQLPNDFTIYNEPLSIEVLFVFPPLSSFPKKKIAEIESGAIIYKDTKPDLTDNLMKGLVDAMQGIVFVDDSRICEVRSKKIYGTITRTEVTIKPILS